MTRAETISSVAVTAESGSPNRPSAASPVALLLALAIHATCCMAFGGSASKITPAAPAPGSDAAEVFDSLRQARFEAMKTPPTWVGSLEPLAQRGASRLAAGGNLDVSTNDIASQAAYRFGRNVSVWSFVGDALTMKSWPVRMVASHSLSVAIGVALMQTTAPGRYAIFVIIPEPGR